ncbi:MAG: YpjP family protein [Heyndrickxia sp.]
MKKWMKKSIVVLVSIFTFGMVTPTHAFWNGNQDVDKSEQQKHNQQSQNQVYSTLEEKDDRESFINNVMAEAEKQSIEKFGVKIAPVIEDEFRQVILPNIQNAIEMTVAEYPEEKLDSLAISESPSGGVAEKIFHIYDTNTNEDIIRFHVRRDHPPMDGYYFNFHYHVQYDNYQKHYALGTIYWDKNTPPKWMSA